MYAYIFFSTLPLAARVSSGAPWPDSPETPGGVVLLSTEDIPAELDITRIAAYNHHRDATNWLRDALAGGRAAGQYELPLG